MSPYAAPQKSNFPIIVALIPCCLIGAAVIVAGFKYATTPMLVATFAAITMVVAYIVAVSMEIDYRVVAAFGGVAIMVGWVFMLIPFSAFHASAYAAGAIIGLIAFYRFARSSVNSE